MKDTFAYLLSVSALVGLTMDFPKCNRFCIAVCVIAYFVTSVYEKFEE